MVYFNYLLKYFLYYVKRGDSMEITKKQCLEDSFFPEEEEPISFSMDMDFSNVFKMQRIMQKLKSEGKDFYQQMSEYISL